MEESGRGYGITNLRTFVGGNDFDRKAEMVDYSSENSITCHVRCVSRWKEPKDPPS